MRGAIVIAGKDLRNIFISPIFYILSGACTLVWSIFFMYMVTMFRDASQFAMGPNRGRPIQDLIASHYSLVNLFLIFVVAAITMRTFTEEKRQRTYDLLLTAPVTATEIALGKLIAGVLTVWAMILIASVMPLSLAFYTQLDWGALLSTVIGILLLSACYVATGMFASSLTQSAVVAVLLAPVFNLMLWFIGAFGETASTPGERAVFEHISVNGHLQSFLHGNFTLAGLVYFLSVVFLFTFLTQRVVESSRWR